MGSDGTTEIVFQIPGFQMGSRRGEEVAHFHAHLPYAHRAEEDAHHADNASGRMRPCWMSPCQYSFRPRGSFSSQDGHMVDLQNKGMAYQQNMLWIDDIDAGQVVPHAQEGMGRRPR